MDWAIVFGFDADYLSAVDQAVLTETGLVRTTVDPARAARWPSREAVAAWLDSVGLSAGPVPQIGVGTGELTPVPWSEPIPGLHPFGIQFEMRVRSAKPAPENRGLDSPKPSRSSAPTLPTARKRVRDESMPLFGSLDDGQVVEPAPIPPPPAEPTTPPPPAVRGEITVYRSDCASYIRSTRLAAWEVYSFVPIPAEMTRGENGRAFVRSEPFPIVLSAPPGSKLVAHSNGNVGLVTSTKPCADQCAEIAVGLARQGRRGLAIVRQGVMS